MQTLTRSLMVALPLVGLWSVSTALLGETLPKNSLPHPRKASEKVGRRSAPRYVRSPAERQEPTATAAPTSDYVSLSLQVLDVYYIEKFPTPPTDTEKGVLKGIGFEVQQVFGERWVGRLVGDVIFGSTTYTGALQDGTPLVATTNDLILDSRLTMGYSVRVSDTSHWAPYVGVGTHFWKRSLLGSSGYPESYFFLYLPVGMRFEFKLADAVDLALDASVFATVAGSIQVGLSQLNPPLKDAGGSLGNSWGYRASVPLSYWWSEKLRLKIEPYILYYGIGQGSTFSVYSTSGTLQGTAYEPASITYYYGGNLGLAYHF